jgi:hypothetical protein
LHTQRGPFPRYRDRLAFLSLPETGAAGHRVRAVGGVHEFA